MTTKTSNPAGEPEDANKRPNIHRNASVPTMDAFRHNAYAKWWMPAWEREITQDGALGPLDWAGPLLGLKHDIKRRCAIYGSDWGDGFKAANIQKVVSASLFLFFVNLSPAIAFGDNFDEGTEGGFGIVETVFSSALSGILYGALAGQPLTILGATGPFLAYTLVVYNLSDAFDFEFLPFYFWVCMWCALFTVCVAVFNVCALLKHVTKFTEEIFAFLISFIFIWRAIIPSIEILFDDERELAGAFLELILAAGTYFVARLLTGMQRRPWGTAAMRTMLANFGVTIAIVLATAVSFIWKDDEGVDMPMLEVPSKFEPTMRLKSNEVRSWIVNPFGIEDDFPVWAIFFAAVPAMGFAVLGYFDQNLTSLLVNRPANNLKKPPAYHLDLFVRGGIITPICAFLGVPLSVASTVPSIVHVISLSTYEYRQIQGGERKIPVDVVEQRVSNVLIHILIGLSLLAAPVLRNLPKAILRGVFLFMGISSLNGNSFWERICLYFIFDQSKYPQYDYVQKLPANRIHLFTFLQIILFAILRTLQYISAISVVFPFFLIVIVFARKGFVKIFSDRELELLDGKGVVADEMGDSSDALPGAQEAQPSELDGGAGQNAVHM